MDWPAEATVTAVLAQVAGRPPTLAAGRLLCLDGPTGSGKTSLAAALADASGAPVLHMDDLYEGWEGLAAGVAQLRGVLAALAEGRPARYRRYDWYAGGFAETREVSPAPLLIVEGVGSGAASLGGLITLLVWVTGPATERLDRAVARDGAEAEPQLRAWERRQNAHFRADRTADRADLAVGSTPTG